MEDVLTLGKKAQAAARRLAVTSTATRNAALEAMADALEAGVPRILEGNEKDMEAARAAGTSDALLDRLRLDEGRIREMAAALRELVAFPDPIGEVVAGWRIYNGLKIRKVRVPLGVIGMIYEARPNVTVDSAGLCLKAANAVILKGGSSARHSNIVLADVIARAAVAAGLPEDSIQLLADTDRAATVAMMGLVGYIDVLIPRGGGGLIRTVVENAKVPVIETGEGVCHVYLDASAEAGMAENIVINAKCQRPGVCNAAETLLVHASAAGVLLPRVAGALRANGVELVGDERARELFLEMGEASDEDYATEYLALKMSVKIVDSLEEAVDHIARFGTRHSEAIITSDYESAQKFTGSVDAAAVYVNASTRFTDGGQFGMGAEIGISTQKLHARGPMGVRELTSVKYICEGDGQTRS